MYNLSENWTSIYPNFPWDFVQEYRGFQTQELSVAIPMTVVNLVIFVTGLLGNIAVCVVIIKHSSLHTATNYYLFNLAVSDLTLLIFGLPFEVMMYWYQYPWVLGIVFCKLRTLLSEMASYVSVLTIVAFSTERYLAICHPLYLYTMSGFQRAVKIIVVIWIVSLFSALPFSIYTKIDEIDFPRNSGKTYIKESAVCAMLYQPIHLPLTSTIIFFIIPMAIIALEYTCMGMQISKRTKQSLGGSSTNNRGSRRSKSHKIIIRMLGVVVAAFFICWAPFHAQRLFYEYGQESECFETLSAYFFYVTGIFYYLSSTLNPILYNIMSKKYRVAFKEVLCGGSRRVLTRTSTLRETKECSPQSSEVDERHSQRRRLSSNRMSSRRKPSFSEFNDDFVTISSRNGCSLVYQINYLSKDFTGLKPNSETVI